MARIVVGVDGSKGSLAALRWAVEEAQLRGAELHAIQAWTYPYFVSPPHVPMAMMPAREELEKGERAVLDESLQAAVPAESKVTVRAEVIEGPAAAALVEAGKDADLLVVGRRGHGGFVGLLLGSVSQQVVHHATCPVVIVPPPED